MRLYDDICYQLLLDIYPALRSSLLSFSTSQPLWTGSRDPSALSLQNWNDVLNNDIEYVGLVFTPAEAERHIAEDLLDEATLAIDSLLHGLEQIIVVNAGIVSSEERGNSRTEEFPRLLCLQRCLKDPKSLPPRLISFEAKVIKYRQASICAQLFIRIMGHIFSPMDGDNSSQRVDLPLSTSQQNHITQNSARQFSKLMVRLFEFLDTSICNSPSRHHAGNLLLSRFDFPDQDLWELEMLLRVCKSQGDWHSARIQFDGTLKQQRHQDHLSLCEQLSNLRGRRKSKPLHIVVTESDIQQELRHSGPTPIRPEPLEITLSEILRFEKKEREKNDKYRKLSRNAKRDLGFKIAVTLMNTFTTSVFQRGMFNRNSIYVLADDSKNSEETTKAYVSFKMGDSSAETDNVIDEKGRDLTILFLAGALLELELEEEIEPTEEDVDESGNRSLHEALNRIYVEVEEKGRTGEIDKLFPQVIDECLDLFEESADFLRSDDREGIQAELYNRVVEPLAKRLDVFCRPQRSDLQHTTYGRGQSTSRQGSWKDAKTPSSLSTFSIAKEIQQTGKGPLGRLFRGGSRPVTSDGLVSGQRQHLGPYASSQRPGVSLALRHNLPDSDTTHRSQQETTLGNFMATSISNSDEINSELLIGSPKSSEDWLDRIDLVNGLVERTYTSAPASKVRIAILDTGCDIESPVILDLNADEEGMKARWHDWAGDETDPVDRDPSRHGTSTAALLMRVAPNAHIFIGRIACSASHLNSPEARENVVKALEHAAHTWNADIITLSFGFRSHCDKIKRAISGIVSACEQQGRGILIFAAANNDGLNEGEMFPASHRDVISVRGTSHVGDFVSAYSPKAYDKYEPLFGTLGLDVPYDPAYRYDPEKSTSRISGCSVATPILAGLVAIVIQVVTSSFAADTKLRKALRTKIGVQAVLEAMGEETTIHSARGFYVSPWAFFRRDHSERLALLINAVARL